MGMGNQEQMWDSIYSQALQGEVKSKPSGFVEEVEANLNPNSYVLELGCGLANDSMYLVSKGHRVTASDFSVNVIQHDLRSYGQVPNIIFSWQDLAQPFNYDSNSFDLVYARLSLHYFNHKVTKLIFSEISRVLRPDGRLAFMCKSTKDPLYGLGSKIEDNMFDLNGHIRHFFDKDYVETLLDKKFIIDELIEEEIVLKEKTSAVVKVIATNKA